jgi:hypothetical protein
VFAKRYIDVGMALCPHCQRPQAPVLVPLEPILPKPALLEERYKRPPPPPPKKSGAKGARKPPPPPPPAPPKKRPSGNTGDAAMPDISTLHLTLSHIFEDEGKPGETEDEEEEVTALLKPPADVGSDLETPSEEAPKPEYCFLFLVLPF